MKCAGLIYGDSEHYIDHLAPFCSLMQWPLLVCDPHIAELCRLYYPELQLIETSHRDLINDFPERLVTCEPRLMLEEFLPAAKRYIWLPHGLSDKGWKTPSFEALSKEDLLLIYGHRMKQVLETKKVAIPTLSIGAFRFHYYKKHQQFYDNLLESKIGSSPYLLFAPTWEDSDKNGTFFQVYSTLMASLSKNSRLMIKLHPNTQKKFLPQIERAKGLASSNVLFLENFPPVFPLLSRAEAYIGDRSSIGYDFLHFEKPMYFLTPKMEDPNQDPSSYLMQGGKQIEIHDNSYRFPIHPLSEGQRNAQQKLRDHSFCEDGNWREKLMDWL